MSLRIGTCACLPILLLVPACSNGPRLYDVSGTVLFDGNPVEQGDIIFVAADNAATPGAGKIAGGEFHLKVSAGKKKVKIAASRKIPGKGAMGEDFVYQSYIPRCYNDDTILEVEVIPTSDNRFPFELSGAKKDR